MLVWGVKEKSYVKGSELVCKGCCSSKCLGGMGKVLNEKWGMSEGLMSRVECRRGSEKTVEGGCMKEWRGGGGGCGKIMG